MSAPSVEAAAHDNAPTRAEIDPTSRLIIEEAKRRGITVQVLAPRAEYFRLSFGPRAIVCRESLSELTHAVALSRCDDKRTTSELLAQAGLCVPEQALASSREHDLAFLRKHGSIVVKPARGEQGKGVCVGVSTPAALSDAIARASLVSHVVLLEQLVRGDDLRIIVIDGKLVAAAVRKPAQVVGDGQSTVRELIVRTSRARAAATFGESTIPLDGETERCVRDAGFSFAHVLATGQALTVRGTANLHTGGTIEDVTEALHPELARVACRAAEVLDIPVVGLDLIVASVRAAEDIPVYAILEANERPGLANHEPQPTAARFVDFLFPETV
jgi:GNAT-family acetyltransferase (TIGR03103 family)